MKLFQRQGSLFYMNIVYTWNKEMKNIKENKLCTTQP